MMKDYPTVLHTSYRYLQALSDGPKSQIHMLASLSTPLPVFDEVERRLVRAGLIAKRWHITTLGRQAATWAQAMSSDESPTVDPVLWPLVTGTRS